MPKFFSGSGVPLALFTRSQNLRGVISRVVSLQGSQLLPLCRSRARLSFDFLTVYQTIGRGRLRADHLHACLVVFHASFTIPAGNDCTLSRHAPALAVQIPPIRAVAYIAGDGMGKCALLCFDGFAGSTSRSLSLTDCTLLDG